MAVRLMNVLCRVLVYALFSGVLWFFFKQKTAYEMRISDWSSDVCSSDLLDIACGTGRIAIPVARAGIPVTGIDLSPQMLERARRLGCGLPLALQQIGSASCRERVCQDV